MRKLSSITCVLSIGFVCFGAIFFVFWNFVKTTTYSTDSRVPVEKSNDVFETVAIVCMSVAGVLMIVSLFNECTDGWLSKLY